MPAHSVVKATCENCFFGVELLCCIHTDQGVCPTYRDHDSERSGCLRRDRRETEQPAAADSVYSRGG